MAKNEETIAATTEDEKWKIAVIKAKQTAAWAKTMTKVVISQNNSKPPFWHVINFLGAKKAEPRGIVDLLAVRKNQSLHPSPLKRGDLLDVVLIQVKGGSAKRPADPCGRDQAEQGVDHDPDRKTLLSQDNRCVTL